MNEMRTALVLILLTASVPAGAQIYRWVDAQGRVNFSNTTPPQGVKATVVDPSAREAPPAAQSTECYTIRCQGERMDERERKREAELAKAMADHAAATPPRARGLEFRKYISIQRGMSEGELLGIAGEPDLVADQGYAIAAPATVNVSRHLAVPSRAGLKMKTYTYLPVPGDPFTTTITLVGGRVTEIERIRRF